MSEDKPSEKGIPNPYRPNLWGMIKEVLLGAMARGQLLMAFVGLIVMIMVLKMPSSDITKIFKGTFSLIKSSYMYGWIISFIVTPTAVAYSIRMRRLHRKELERYKK